MMNTVLKRIKENYDRLSPSHKVIAEFIMQNHEQITEMTARDLAAKTLSVPSAIISFSKKLGYKGFNELKFNYENEKYNENIIDNGITEAFAKAHQVTLREEFLEAVNLLKSAPKIFIIAFQMSQIPAKDFYFRMRKIEPSKMIFFETYADQFRMASLMEDSDVALIVSNSGKSDEIINIEKELTKKGCKQILVTNGINTPLGQFSTIELSIGCVENNPVLFKEAPTKARYALLYLLEKIYLEILNDNFEEKYERIKRSSKLYREG